MRIVENGYTLLFAVLQSFSVSCILRHSGLVGVDVEGKKRREAEEDLLQLGTWF